MLPLLKTLEDMLYGTDAGDGTQATEPKLPLPDKVIEIFGAVVSGG